MKISKYLLIRIITLIIGFIVIWNIAYYTLPKYIQEDDFVIVAELDRIFSLNLYFSIIFLIFILIEIYLFNKRKQTKLKNQATILSIFLTVLIVVLIYFYKSYSF